MVCVYTSALWSGSVVFMRLSEWHGLAFCFARLSDASIAILVLVSALCLPVSPGSPVSRCVWVEMSMDPSCSYKV